jgi:serine/threonine protein kinase
VDDAGVVPASVVRRPEIDGYRLGEPIGTGTYSVVYAGERIGSGQRVAMKVLNGAADPDMRQRFARELEIMGRLAEHRYVVTILDWGEVDGQPWIAMERLSTSLAVEDGYPRRLDAQRVADVGVQVACALATMHGAGILHRDVKPSNLLQATDGLLKLADFGIAKHTVPRSKLDTIGPIGTAAYMAPEVLDGSRPADAMSDQYGLCATLVSLLLGSPCGAELQDSDVESLRSRGVTDAPDDLLDVLARGLRRDPDERHGSLDDLARAFEEVQRSHGWKGELYVPPMPLVESEVPAPSDQLSAPLLSPATLPPFDPSPSTAWPSRARDRRRGTHTRNRRNPGAARWEPTWMWIAVGTAGALVVAGITTWVVTNRRTGFERSQAPPEVTAVRTSVVDQQAPTNVTTAVRDESVIDVVWDYPYDSAQGFLAFVNGARQPAELPQDARSTTLTGFIGERRLCIEVAAVLTAGTTDRSQPSCVDARFEPSLPPAGTPPDDPAAAEQQIREAMSLIYGRVPRAGEHIDDSTGVEAAVARLFADANAGPNARSATPEVSDIVFTSPA